MDTVRYETDGPLAVLTMTREPYNLLGPQLSRLLLSALDRASSEKTRAVLLRSGLRHFSAGAERSLFETVDSTTRFDP
jgi:enoyl-CoA hydratase/carnithine racemase